MEFPHPLLVCDIGGTNVRMGLVHERGAKVVSLSGRLSAAFPDFLSCVQKALEEIGEPPRSIMACGAGPVVGRRLHLTNAAWTIDGPQTAYQLGLSQGLLLNDFEAQALSLPMHRTEWLRLIGPQLPLGHGPRLILGPGTGLGVAALIGEGKRYQSLPSEAAHTELAPSDDEEQAIWAFVERPHGRLTAESLISGPGMARLHQARARASARAPDEFEGPGIIAAAKANPEGEAAATIRHFWRLVARLSGDMALTFLARGGVTLSGGLLPRITEFLDPVSFRSDFEAKAPMEDLVRAIPTQLLLAKDAVLEGMAAIAANPQDYVIDYGARAWR